MNPAPQRVLIVATTTGYQIRAFGEAAARRGVRLVFASDRCDRLEDPWWDQAIPVRFHEENRSVEAVVAACAGAPPDGIIAVGDRPVILGARLAQAFGIPWHSPEAAAISRNKLLSRRAFEAAGLPTPWFESTPIDADAPAIAARMPYPVVVKPLAQSGSRGVIRADNPAEFVAAFDRVRRLLASPDVRIERDEAHRHLVVESFIPGLEYAIEAVLEHGRFTLLAVFDKPDPLDGPFFEETIYLTPSRAPEEVQRRMVSVVADAARAIGLHHGPVHAECRVNGTSVHVLEVAGRPIGGLCSQALRFADAPGGDSQSLEDVLLRHALGESVVGWRREPAASGVMMIPIPKPGVYRAVAGVDEARAIRGIEDVRITAKSGMRLVPLPEGKSYLGFIFARGADPSAVEQALRAAHSRLDFAIDRELAVVG
jgi:hypothetical protein